ncbi:MAG TPA: FAD-binding oxidoreductase [Actinomycetes bacterium]|jgi:glycine/D-amino acid oxidase-like deaminating enzyme|nr:FAD-binding oxidoreductase [Actinomycetes bacterium]
MEASPSWWQDSLPTWSPRQPLAGDLEVDVAIVGAGYTGLWTAYYLAAIDPELRVAVLEREVTGFGASGRNGGWCSALFPASAAKLARIAGRDAAIAMQRAMRATLDEVERVVRAESIDCHWARGGTVVLARSPLQLARAGEAVAEARSFGAGEEDLRLLGAEDASRLLAASGVLGGTWTPHCAAIHPLRLARGLAEAAERRGVRLFEGTAVTSIEPGMARTGTGVVRARQVVRATEGYSPGLPGLRRAVAPVFSLMIATEPLTDEQWAAIGLRRRETFSDYRNVIIYGQRTADGRLTFGGRGAPYHFGSRVRPEFDREPAVFAKLRRTLVELFPVLEGVRVTHAWGGALGVPRDWCASVGLDRSTGLGWAGGYVGDGVGTSNLAGRTLADLITGRDSDLVRLAWVGHHSRPWEPEPLRWLGVNGTLRLAAWADRSEARSGRRSRAAAVLARLTGG